MRGKQNKLHNGGLLAKTLIMLLVALFMVACSESTKTDDTVDYTKTVEVTLGKVVASRDLSQSSESYTLMESEELYWTYTAVKNDEYFVTGQAESETDLNEGAKGLPSSLPGKYSLGKWIFTFNAYQEVTDDEGNTNKELYYKGIATSKTLTSTDNTLEVKVQLVESEDETGTLVIKGIEFRKSSGTEETITGSHAVIITATSSDDTEIVYDTILYTKSDDGFTVTSGNEDSSVIYDIESVEGCTDFTASLDTGYYTITIKVYEYDGESVGDEALLTVDVEKVLIKPNLTTTITGSVSDGDSGAVIIYFETDDDGGIVVDVAYGTASTSEELATALTSGSVTLTANITDRSFGTIVETSSSSYTRYLTDPDDGVSEYTIDLNGYTLDLNYITTNSIVLEEYSTVTIKGGTINCLNSYSGTKASIMVIGSATLILEDVTYEGGIIFAGGAGDVQIKDSTFISSANYAIGTNNVSSQPTANITVENSTIYNVRDDGDATAICFNVPGNYKLKITDSTIVASKQAAMIRGADAEISKSRLISLGNDIDTSSKQNIDYSSNDWNTGNYVPYVTLAIGNRSSSASAYAHSTSVTLTDSELYMYTTDNSTDIEALQAELQKAGIISSDDSLPTPTETDEAGDSTFKLGVVYVAADNGYSVDFTYSGVTGAFGTTTYTTDSDIVGSNYWYPSTDDTYSTTTSLKINGTEMNSAYTE